MIFNVWLEIRDNFPWPAGEPGDDTEVQGKNRLNLGQMPDQAIVTQLYKSRKQGPRFYYLYNMYYDVETQAEMELAVRNLQWDNPGHVVILGGWNWDGSQILDEAGEVLYLQAANLIQKMPDDPVTGDPATALTDVNLLFGQSPRVFS